MIKKFYRWAMNLPTIDNGYKFDAKIFEEEFDTDSEHYKYLKDDCGLSDTYDGAKDLLRYAIIRELNNKYKQIAILQKEKDIMIEGLSKFI